MLKFAMIISIDEKNKMIVEKSCGCIWCDLGFERTKLKRNFIHYIKYKIHVCTLPRPLDYKPKNAGEVLMDTRGSSKPE
jgi:thioredoxin-related protein